MFQWTKNCCSCSISIYCSNKTTFDQHFQFTLFSSSFQNHFWLYRKQTRYLHGKRKPNIVFKILTRKICLPSPYMGIEKHSELSFHKIIIFFASTFQFNLSGHTIVENPIAIHVCYHWKILPESLPTETKQEMLQVLLLLHLWNEKRYLVVLSRLQCRPLPCWDEWWLFLTVAHQILYF